MAWGKSAANAEPATVSNPAPVTESVTVPGALDQPAGKPPKSYRYRCKEPCTFMKRYRGVGDIVVLPEKTDNPHFELIA
jgi:hypothetical protein